MRVNNLGWQTLTGLSVITSQTKILCTDTELREGLQPVYQTIKKIKGESFLCTILHTRKSDIRFQTINAKYTSQVWK